ncbi:serine/arginine repetitive matrix protein 1-like [Panicum virgatum]|uniref:serine/arginine repetitive matrix protein 1-like n=1 Tax=Panicum virgatum TaxID=38727 RepID=UPI0019D5ACC1|nr:serine/arginine repetitive matrix protein 1-like [Panicum virgatum]
MRDGRLIVAEQGWHRAGAGLPGAGVRRPSPPPPPRRPASPPRARRTSAWNASCGRGTRRGGAAPASSSPAAVLSAPVRPPPSAPARSPPPPPRLLALNAAAGPAGPGGVFGELGTTRESSYISRDRMLALRLQEEQVQAYRESLKAWEESWKPGPEPQRKNTKISGICNWERLFPVIAFANGSTKGFSLHFAMWSMCMGFSLLVMCVLYLDLFLDQFGSISKHA